MKRSAKSGADLRAQLRVYDGVGRYGGEEFLLVLPNCDLPNAVLRADALREFIAASPVVCCNEEKPITMSMGVASLRLRGKGRNRSPAESGRRGPLRRQRKRPKPGRALHCRRQEDYTKKERKS